VLASRIAHLKINHLRGRSPPFTTPGAGIALANPIRSLALEMRVIHRGIFMNRLMSSLAVLAAASFAPGCATTSRAPAQPAAATTNTNMLENTAVAASSACAGPQCSPDVLRVAQRTDVPVEKDAPAVAGHPLTSVVVTQCNLIVAVYMTMPDGSLLRFDSKAAVPADQLLQMAYTATRSERVEVSCNEAGAVGYEQHDPV
jgi:hypothetical protein